MMLIYGAYGYTGELITRRAVELGLHPVLAGRNPERLARLANEHGLEYRPAALDDARALRSALNGMRVVIHAAGPFVHTSAPMLEACLTTGVHYLDITGEIPVFEALAREHDRARAAGIVVLPGAGFDVVPSDCLALFLARRVSSPEALRLGISSRGGLSRGTASTMLEHLGSGAMVRERGELRRIELGARRCSIDFGSGPVTSAAIAWGDVASAWYSTRIPNIEVYWAVPRLVSWALPWVSALAPLLSVRPLKAALQRRIDRSLPGPNQAQRARGSSVFWGEVRGAGGARASARLYTPEAYTLTAQAAVLLAQKVLSSSGSPGFHTPASAFGPDLVLELAGVRREVLA